MTVKAGSVSVEVIVSVTVFMVVLGGVSVSLVSVAVVSVAVVVSVLVIRYAVGMPVVLSVPVTMC
jgi:hypothetical protein